MRTLFEMMLDLALRTASEDGKLEASILLVTPSHISNSLSVRACSDYSRQIMEITSDKLESDSDLKDALDVAHSKTRIPGSCTACLVKMDKETGALSALNLGDSGFVILRENVVLARSAPQQHFFDCPRQLAAFPEHCDNTDYPRDGQMFSVQLQEGDLIVMGNTFAMALFEWLCRHGWIVGQCV